MYSRYGERFGGESLRPLSQLEDWKLREEDYDARGWTVVADDDANVGSVDDLIVDTDKREVALLVIAYDQILGFGGKKTLVPTDRVRLYPDQEGVIFDGSASEIKNGPEYKSDTNDYKPFFKHWGIGEKVEKREVEAGRKGGATAVETKERGKIDLNQASRDDLIAIKGIGPVLADNIIHYREEHKFKRFNELDNVPGISDETIREMKKHFSV